MLQEPMLLSEFIQLQLTSMHFTINFISKKKFLNIIKNTEISLEGTGLLSKAQ